MGANAGHHGRRGPVARARHRRQHGDLLADRFPPDQVLTCSRTGSTRPRGRRDSVQHPRHPGVLADRRRECLREHSGDVAAAAGHLQHTGTAQRLWHLRQRRFLRHAWRVAGDRTPAHTRGRRAGVAGGRGHRLRVLADRVRRPAGDSWRDHQARRQTLHDRRRHRARLLWPECRPAIRRRDRLERLPHALSHRYR